MKFISLFTGAGGLDLGLEAAGFRVALCVEKDPIARQTLAQNRPEWLQAEPGDIHQWDPETLLRFGGIRARQVSLVAAGPPCQPFSKAGYWANGNARRMEDPRASTLKAFLEVAEQALPKVVLLENVKGITFNGKDEGIEHLRRGFARINRRCGTQYSLQVLHLNAADYGVPQIRERVFLVAHRDGLHLQIPAPTHFPNPYSTKKGKLPYLTAWDAIGDLDNGIESLELALTGRWADLLPCIPEGRNYLWHTESGGGRKLFGWRTRYWSFLLKLSKQRPSWTISAEPGPATGPFHWKNRRLSPRELCRLQTFPDDFKPVGTLRDVQRQIGNATPPLLAEVLGREICRQWLGHVTDSDLKFIIKHKSGCPPPERTKRVPRKYLYREGQHKPHPGPGLGPRASSDYRK
jgi:DNA (cytosine-5)-methyltransferase 1